MDKKLNHQQRDFFRQIAQIAFCNPFNRQIDALEYQILRIPDTSVPPDKRLLLILDAIGNQFSVIDPLGKNISREYKGRDRTTLEICWLYYQYHCYQEKFDLFIQDQQQAGDTPLPLPFADRLIEDFEQAGFNREETAKYIALFFQLRRGFYFISRGVYGHSPSMIELRIHLWNNIFTFQPEWYLDFLCEQMEDFSTLLLGETGTGKSMVAHAIGNSGFIPFDPDKRKFKESFTRAFQSINLSQYPASLLESELFGHKKGAFTGAIDNHQGIFARCSTHGAVFIDEIGDIDIPTQVKLLTVLQERIFCPVGNHEKQRFEGRVIAATNRDIQQLRTTGHFRDDLYYRLCSDVITIPSLRQRLQEDPEELRILIRTILARMFPDTVTDLSSQIERRIRTHLPENYSWPGNVRELEQCIRRICLTGQYFPDENNMRNKLPSSTLATIGDEQSAQQVLQKHCQRLYERYGSYEAVARISKLDRRTVKKYITLETSTD